MAPIVTTAVIGRPAARVFAYATDPARFSEWQTSGSAMRARKAGRPPPTLGCYCPVP
jgi:uncharacterized protein YndB with AHSA1/START domain